MSGEDQFLVHNFPEYRAFRDVVFWFKYVQCIDDEVFPELAPYTYDQAKKFAHQTRKGTTWPCRAICSNGAKETRRRTSSRADSRRCM